MNMKTFAAALFLCSTLTAFGQGTVQFSNGLFTRLSTTGIPSGGGYGVTPVPTIPGLMNYGLFYGIGESTSLTLLSTQLGVNSTTAAGFIANSSDSTSLMTAVQIPGTTSNETDVFLQVLGWSASYGTDWASARTAFQAQTPYVFYGQTGIANISPLGASGGPGVAIWQNTSGTSPNLLTTIIIPEYVPVPEPSAFALAGLGAALGMIWRFARRAGKA